METVAIILSLLLAVVVSDFAVRVLGRVSRISIPRPIVQIAFGALIGLTSDRAVALDPDVFFLLFLPPLLFLDGWRIPPEELFKDRATVVQLAFGLVVFTVLGVGVFIHWLIPAMPLAVAFALAAVLSPTDPIAVSAIAQRVPMPRRMMRILEGESLLNDASGLVCFSFAVAAMMTGTFSWTRAALDLVWVATGGLAVGVGLTFVLTWLKNLVSRQLGEDSGSQILISLLIPFGCYLLAEELHCSGILAAVAAGMTMSAVESSGQAMAVTRIRRNTFWDVIQFAANGIIFVLLGEQLHSILIDAPTTVRLTGHAHPGWLVIYVLAITASLATLRFAWVLVSLRLNPMFEQRGADPQSHLPPRPGWRAITVMSLAGVRGAVTLAGVLSLPLVLRNGAPFPGRDLAIVVSMGVITVSLVIASIALPLLLAGQTLPVDSVREAEEASTRIAAAHAAIAEIEARGRHRSANQPDADIVMAAAARVMGIYRARIESRAGDEEAIALTKRGEVIERELRIAALQAERAEIYRELRAHRLGSETARKLVREVDLLEARHTE